MGLFWELLNSDLNWNELWIKGMPQLNKLNSEDDPAWGAVQTNLT